MRVCPAVLLLLAACTHDTTDQVDTGTPTPAGPDYSVQIRTTSYGIPHILADDYVSAGVGVGWAVARDHLCTLADQFVKVNSQRARYHGAGDGDDNVDRDFGWLGLGVRSTAEATFDALPDVEREAMIGFATGYNRYLADTPDDAIDPRCRDAAWIVPIDAMTLYTYYLSLGQNASGQNLLKQVGQAQPPRVTNRGVVQQVPPPPLSILAPFEDLPIGSNGWGIGADRTESGRGMLLSNTHFPSQGQLQWWENQVTITGELNVYGAALLGSVLPNLGFNDNVAWTHTVSNTPRFVVYQLALHPDDPTQYLFDGSYVPMESTRFQIDVLNDDGTLATRSRTLYRTQWGPVFNAPLVGWTRSAAFTWRDVNASNYNLISVFRRMALSSDLAQFKAAHRDTQGIPWVHTMYADRQGNAFYTDSAATPNLSEAAVAAYRAYVEQNFLAATFAGSGVWVVEGSDPVYTWIDDPRAVLPGAIPFDDAPQLERRDFVNNANMNYWMSNPLAPLEGYAPIYGATGLPLRPRTKMNNRFLLEDNGVSGADHRFSLDELEAAALSARASVSEDLLTQVLARCGGAGPVTVSVGGPPQVVDISEACAVLGAWDGRSTVDSVGAHVWREFVGNQLNGEVDYTTQGRLYADAFDPEDPIYTPTTLAVAAKDGTDTVLESLAAAVLNLQEAGVSLDARLGDIQVYVKGGERYARPGGQYLEGLITIATYSGAPDSKLPFEAAPPTVNPETDLQMGGYQVNNGNSFVMAMEFTDDGPRARAIMVYSESENPDSAHFADQTALYTQPQLRPVRFTEQDILADPELEIVTLSSAD